MLCSCVLIMWTNVSRTFYKNCVIVQEHIDICFCTTTSKELNNKFYIQQPFQNSVSIQQLLFMYRRSVHYRTNSIREKIILSFSCLVFDIFNKLSTNLAAVMLFFSRNIVCAGYHRKTWIQAVCALCTHPSFSRFVSHTDTHTTQMRPDPTLLLRLVAWHKGDPSFPTHHLKRKKIKKTQRAVLLFSREKTHSVTAAILNEITVGTQDPCCLCIPLASCHWWFVCVHNESASGGGVNTFLLLVVSICR